MMRWRPRRKNTPVVARDDTTVDIDDSACALLIFNTSPYPADQVEALVRFGFVDVLNAGVEVHVKGSNRSYRGRAYDGIPRMANVADSARYLVTIGLSRTKSGLPRQVIPGTKRLQRRYPNGMPVDHWKDLLVYVAAHEARHIWQFKARRNGHDLALSEVDADTYAIDILNEWRLTSGRNPFGSEI